LSLLGAGPAGMTVAKYFIIFERRLGFGGGIGGGGMLLHKIVVDENTLPILKDFNISYAYDDEENLSILLMLQSLWLNLL